MDAKSAQVIVAIAPEVGSRDARGGGGGFRRGPSGMGPLIVQVPSNFGSQQMKGFADLVGSAVEASLKPFLAQIDVTQRISEALEEKLHAYRGEFEAVATELQRAIELRAEALQISQQATDPPFLDATEFARRMGVSDQTIRNLEKEDKLFSVLPVGRARGRQYPTFQLYPGVAGEPLVTTLEVLRGLDGATRYQFFTTPIDLLEGLSPVLVLLGLPQGMEPKPRSLQHRSLEERRQVVLKAAQAYRDLVEA